MMNVEAPRKIYDEIVIYFNPHCSVCWNMVCLLQQKGVTPTRMKYVSERISHHEIERMMRALGCDARGLLRKHYPLREQLKLDNPRVSDYEIIEALMKYPALLERPLVFVGKKAVIARPAEKILEILG